MKNPYVELEKHIQRQGSKYNPPSIDVGKVVSGDPLIINIGDLSLTKDNLLAADFLFPNYSRKFTIPSTTATGSTTEESITSIGIPDGVINFTDGLKKDDLVACLATNDRQLYIILCRVVRP